MASKVSISRLSSTTSFLANFQPISVRSTRSISSSAIGAALDRPVYGGFVDLQHEDPRPAEALTQAELPELDNGPHFFYGLQWWFFGLLAIFGFGYLAYDERRKLRAPDAAPGTEGGGPTGDIERSAGAPVEEPPRTPVQS